MLFRFRFLTIFSVLFLSKLILLFFIYSHCIEWLELIIVIILDIIIPIITSHTIIDAKVSHFLFVFINFCL